MKPYDIFSEAVTATDPARQRRLMWEWADCIVNEIRDYLNARNIPYALLGTYLSCRISSQPTGLPLNAPDLADDAIIEIKFETTVYLQYGNQRIEKIANVRYPTVAELCEIHEEIVDYFCGEIRRVSRRYLRLCRKQPEAQSVPTAFFLSPLCAGG